LLEPFAVTLDSSGGNQALFWVYVIQNPQGKRYIGQTDRLERRLHQHNDPAYTLTRTTKRFPGSWTLVHSETFPTRAEALAREKALKSSQGRAWLQQHLAR
jgi:putative endonuclease